MTMSDQIIAVLDNICAKFGVAIDWTSENVLPYVMELAGKFIKYEIVTSIVSSVMTLAILFIAFNCFKFSYKKWKEDIYNNSYWDLSTVVFGIIFGALALASIFIVIADVFDIVTCITFPEKAIFEYVSTMMKSA